jgi:hypothetical protein
MFQKFGAAFRARPARPGARVLLAVDLGDAVGAAQSGHQRRQRDLGRISTRLNIDSPNTAPPMRHAVQATGQLAVDPGLDAVGVARAVQRW